MNRICVTGGAGFIGSAYIRCMLEKHRDLHIVNFDKMTYAGNLDSLATADPERHTFVCGDIADRKAIQSAMDGCDAIINFAAETHVDRSIAGATEFIATNVTGVYNVCEAARELGLQRVLLVSTDEIYGSINSGSFRECAPPRPGNPYSATKAAGELVAQGHYNTFRTPVIITRGSNTYGPFQYPEKVVPLFITNALDDEPLPLYRGGEYNVRDWLYVDDHAHAIDHVLRYGTPGEVYNIAGGNERQNIELTKKVLELTGKDESLIEFVDDRPGHDHRYSIDCSKLHSLGWRPETSWAIGMAATVQWYRENEWWWRKTKSGDFRKYYKAQYKGK